MAEHVSATMEHVVTREMAGFDYADYPRSSGTFQIYDWERPGRYRVYGEAYDGDYNEWPSARPS